MRARFAALVLVPWLLALAPPLHAQMRPGLAHRHDASAPATASGAAITHDSDADGALIGAAIGAVALSLIFVVPCDQGDLCSLGIVGGTLIGGLSGLVVGGLLDAADPLTSPEERAAAAESDSVSTRRGREPPSRRNDMIGAAVGAVAGNLLAAGVCGAVSDTGGCPIFHPAYLPAIGIGALLGAGIGSAIGESADEDRE